MRKHVIFKDTSEDKPFSRLGSPKEQTPLSKNEVKKIAQEAYQEGLNDAKIMQRVQLNNRPPPSSKEKTPSQHQENLEKILERNKLILFEAKAVFPFDFFPDTLIIDTTTVSIINKIFFATEQVTTIPLKDLSDVSLQTSLFLAGLTIKYMPQSEIMGMLQPVNRTISCLKRQDAIYAKNILKGMMVAREEQIDISKIDPKELCHMMERLGESKGDV